MSRLLLLSITLLLIGGCAATDKHSYLHDQRPWHRGIFTGDRYVGTDWEIFDLDPQFKDSYETQFQSLGADAEMLMFD
ncbi:hypothetical protein GF373_11325 [bacterium]|nr:hypothetical protein [bacterium]